MRLKFYYSVYIKTKMSDAEITAALQKNITVVDSFFSFKGAEPATVKNLLSGSYKQYYGIFKEGKYIARRKTFSGLAVFARPNVEITGETAGVVKLTFSPWDFEVAGGCVILLLIAVGVYLNRNMVWDINKIIPVLVVVSMYPFWVKYYLADCAEATKFFARILHGRVVGDKETGGPAQHTAD